MEDGETSPFAQAAQEYRRERDRNPGTTRPASVAAITPSPERESRFYTGVSLKGKPVPVRQWLVPDLVPKNTVTLFGGDGGTGKSLVALQLAVSVATGDGWMGRCADRGRVIYLSAEDDEGEIHRRTDDILRTYGRSYDDLVGLTLRSLAGEDALLAFETQVALVQTTLFNELEQLAADETPALIVIDTLADVFPANENDRAKVRQFVGILRGLAIRRKCAVLLLAHPSLTGLSSGSGTSGSTAWNNSVRSRLYLERIAQEGFEANPDARVLRTMKANYGRTGGEIGMTWQNGVFVAASVETGLDRTAGNAKAERVFLSLLRLLTGQGRHVSDKSCAAYAPKLFAEHPKAEGITKRAFKSAMETLMADGKVKIAQDGPPSRRVSFICEVTQ